MTGDAPEHNPPPRSEPTLSDETLSQLEARLDRASEMAERLIVEAAARVAGQVPREPVSVAPEGDPAPGGEAAPVGETAPVGEAAPGGDAGPADGEAGLADGKAPPAGWQRREAPESEGRGSTSRPRGELDLLLDVLASVRERIPPELQHRLGVALREVLMALRALIDWYLERADRRRSEPTEVQDIPII